MSNKGVLAVSLVCAVLSGSIATAKTPRSEPGSFPFHNGDRVVFLGDSITQQQLYTTYVETYLLTRFPDWRLQFRNAGWSGDTSWLRLRGVPADQALQRDVLDLNPTIVTIDFSMNDAGYGAFNQALYDQHMQGEKAIVEGLKKAHVTPVVLTVSGFEKPELGDPMQSYASTLEQFAAGDRMIAQEEGVPFADQFHPFMQAIALKRATDPHARISGDSVHPGPPGHLMMADFILSGLDAPTLVSSASLDGRSGRVLHTDGCEITGAAAQGGGVVFTRLDDALVFPIEPSARPILQVVPVVDDLDRYLLQVAHLTPGSYAVTVNGAQVASFSAAQLEAGVNLAYYDSPLTAPGMAILGHVYNKNNIYYDLWRNVRLGNAPDRDAQIADRTAKIAAEEKQINDLRVPQAYQISVMPVPAVKAPPVSPVPAPVAGSAPPAS